MSVYRVTELIGTSTSSWEDAAAVAVRQAQQTLRDLRVAEVVAQDLTIESDGSFVYRTKLQVSFKYDSD
ncbi:dodecin family protein [Monashia sp. NPDC004114]